MPANLVEREPQVEVLSVPHPFSTARTRIVVKEGETISEIIAQLNLSPRVDVWVELDGWRVPKALWPRTRPKRDRCVVVRAIPRGEGGGDDNKTLRIIILVVILIVAIVTTVLTWGALGPVWAVALGSGILAAGTFAVNMLLPPAVPNLGKLASIAGATGRPQESPSLSITGSRNNANRFGPVPKVFGRHRIFPPLGAVNVTEQIGNDQYLRQLFVVGYGPLEITDIKIGETPIEHFEGVEIEVRQGFLDDDPLTLYSQDMDELPLSVVLTEAGGPQIRSGTQLADELSVDIVFPNGLVKFLNDGTQIPQSVVFEIEYRIVADPPAAWTEIPESPVTVTDNRAAQVRKGFRWLPTPTGQPEWYEVRITRITEDAGDVLTHDQSVWSALRTVRHAPPITFPGLAQIAMRIKATDQLNGVVDTLSCIATAILPDWDADTETWITRATRNPASAYREVLQGPGNARPFPDTRIMLANLQQWHEENEAQGLFYDQVVDFRTTVREHLMLIATAGRANVTLIDGKHGVVLDLPQTVPVQHLTPRNSWGFKGSKSLPDIPHAWKVHFINPEANWEQDELIVYRDGFSAANATKFEVLELTGVTDKDQAWKLGRYHLAALALRPEAYSLNVDVENLVCTRGDLVRVTHDVPLWGYGSGRITDVLMDGSDAEGIVLDEVFPMAEGTPYVVRIRLATGESLLSQINAVPGGSKALTFITPLTGTIPAIGDLVLFGELGSESVECVVKAIEHDRDFVAMLTLLDAAPGIHDAVSGPIPPFETHITRPPLLHQTPPLPIIDDIRSDESVMSRDSDQSLSVRIVLSMRYIANSRLRADWIEVQYRRTDSTSPYLGLPQVSPGTPLISITPVEERVTYEIRARTVNASLGVSSQWATAIHTVIGKTSPPPDPMGLVLVGSLLTWSYPSPPPDLAGFELRQIAGSVVNWEQGLKLHDGIIGPTSFTLPTMMGLRTLMMKAIDMAGNLSVGTATITEDFGAVHLRNIVETQDERALGFPGTKTDATVSGISDDLEADQEPAAFWGPDATPFWTSDAALFWTSPYKQMRYTWTYLTGEQADATTLLLDVVAQGAYRLEWKLTADTEWIPFAGMLGNIQAETSYDLRVTVDGGPVQGIISTLALFLDAPDITESLDDVAIDAAGTRLALVLTYRAIKSVQLTVQQVGAETAVTARTQDKDPDLGPLVETLDPTGTPVDGHVDAVIVGY